MADTPSRSHREVIDLDAEPDPPTPTPSHRPTPEVKSEVDSDTSSTIRVFAKGRARPVLQPDVRKQLLAQQRKLFEDFKASREAESSRQGSLTREEVLAAFGFADTGESASTTRATDDNRRPTSQARSSPVEEDTLDEEELGRRDEYRRQREEILAPGRSAIELDDVAAAEYKELERVEKARRRRRAADIARMLEDESSDAEGEEADDEAFFVREAEFDMAEHLDAEPEGADSDFVESDSDPDDDEFAAGPSTQRSQRRRIARKKRHQKKSKGMHPLRAQPGHQFQSLSTFNPENMQPNVSSVQQPTFNDQITGSTNDVIKRLRARTLANLQDPTDEERESVLEDLSALGDAISWFCGQGRSVKPAPSEAGWKITGFRAGTVLKHYQVFGSGWMREREQGSWLPAGGILADSMGLGKTIQTLAAIADDRPVKIPKSEPHLTLIVASRALLDQWYDEIALHCDPKIIGKVYRYYGDGRKGVVQNKLNHFRGYTIVLTTWYEVRESWPHGTPPKEEITSPEQAKAWRLNLLTNKLILDECQHIKNRNSKISIAASKIKADLRWALSGTLLSNSVSEVYSYLRFLHYPKLPTFTKWSRRYLVPKSWSKDDNLSAEELEDRRQTRNKKNKRLSKCLGRLMLRRVNDYRFLGAPVLSLPATQINHQYVDLNTFEFEVYKIVEHRMQTIVQRMIKADRLRRSYAQVFKMLLILRQLTAHPLLIEKAMREVLLMEDVQQLIDLAEAELGQAKDDERQSNMINLRKVLHNEQMRRLEEHDITENQVPLADPLETGQSYGDSFDFRPVLKDLISGPKNSWKQFRNEMICANCHYKPFAPRITNCQHIYCTECLHEMQLEAALNDEDRARCKQCKVAFEVTQPLKEDIYGSDVEDIPEPDEEELAAAKKRGRGGAKERARAESWIGRDHGCIVPSAKTIAVKAQLMNWIEQDPGVKVLVYCQFLDVIRIIGKMCTIEGWEYVTYHGEMSHERREGSLEVFRHDPNCKVMIGTLKTGGLGLNLTCATRVILVDLWWNQAVSDQAWGRVHRIGQEAETRMTTFVVCNTVDEDMREMQQCKKDNIDAVMEGRDARLNARDICKLFGLGRSAPMPDDLGSSDIEPEDGEEVDDFDAED